MKVYIFIGGFTDMVAGGPIYMRNKIIYCQEHGWHVVVLPVSKGEVYIHGFEPYSHYGFPYLSIYPQSFSMKQRRIMLNEVEKLIPDTKEEVIIETGTDYSALWGELIAKDIGARHIVLWQDESNPNLTTDYLYFLKMKYERHELACISKDAMIHLFNGFMNITYETAYSLKLWCTNSVEDYESPITNEIIQGDYTIGSIGRLDKPVVMAILEGILAFARMVPNKSISVCFFGGAEQEYVMRIKKYFENQNNIRVFITGYVFPIPQKAIEKCDVFVSSAGSSNCSAVCKVQTIHMDIYSHKPSGLVDTVTQNGKTCIQLKECNSVEDYLHCVLIENKRINIQTIKIDEYWKTICAGFDKHMEFLASATQKLSYYNIDRIRLTNKGRIKSLFYRILGFRKAKQVFDAKRKLNRLIKKSSHFALL